jgi:hypothetical protein
MSRDLPKVPARGDVARPAALLLALGFLAILLLPPLAQALRRGVRFDLFRPPRGPLLAHLQRWEKALEAESELSALVQPRVQQAQLALLGQGNGKVLVGRDGWLFYKPDVDFLTGPAIGAPRALRPNEEARSGDPLPAIVKFHRELQAQGVDLVLAPVPVKASIYPEKLAGRHARPVLNAGYADFLRRLEAEGVAVVELTAALWERKEEGLFLPLDSHWTPRGMAVFADALAGELRRRFPYLEGAATAYATSAREVENYGDTFDLLRLPASHPFAKTRVTIETVNAEEAEDSPIVLLGDSATNIYAAEAMNWGRGAGLAEHLALRLGRPIHAIAVNGGAATEVRRRLKAGGRSLVVWQFIARDLTQALWEPVPVDVAPPAPLPPRLEVRARLVARSEPPIPDEAEIYPDTLTRTLYEVERVVEGDWTSKDLLVADWVQRGKREAPAARYAVGEVHHLVLEPLREARRRDKSLSMAGSVDDVKRPDLPVFWALETKKGR